MNSKVWNEEEWLCLGNKWRQNGPCDEDSAGLEKKKYSVIKVWFWPLPPPTCVMLAKLLNFFEQHFFRCKRRIIKPPGCRGVECKVSRTTPGK